MAYENLNLPDNAIPEGSDISHIEEGMNELSNSLANLDMFEELYSDDITTASESYSLITINFTSRSGYTPYLVSAIVTSAIENSANYGYVVPSFVNIRAANVTFNGRNLHPSSDAVYRIKAIIMFVKN